MEVISPKTNSEIIKNNPGTKPASTSQPPLCQTHNKPIEAFCEKYQTLV